MILVSIGPLLWGARDSVNDVNVASQGSYQLIISDQIRFDFDSWTGDISYRNSAGQLILTVPEFKKQSPKWMSEDRVRQLFPKFKSEIDVDLAYLNEPKFIGPPTDPDLAEANPDTGESIPYVGIANLHRARYEAADPATGGVLVDRCELSIHSDSGQLVAVRLKKRPVKSRPLLRFDEKRALEVARWIVADGRPVSTTLDLAWQFNDAQRKYLQNAGMEWDKPRPASEEDDWLLQKYFWNFQFEFGTLKLDAETGRPVGMVVKAPKYRLPQNLEHFGLKEAITVPPPSQMPLPQTQHEVAQVAFNGSVARLHMPPVVQDDCAFIPQRYFPNFLIKTQVEGESIQLQGELKKSGKRVMARLNQTAAMIDGKEVLLSGSPRLIDGELYLPAELLSLSNGIPTRWEPKTRKLWVETRYLRRD